MLENMIVKSANDPHGPATRRKVDQLYSCVRYCEDEFRCRRSMQLEFFGETFATSKCNKTCDNCRASRIPDRRDMTNHAKTILQLLLSIQSRKRATLTQLSDLYRGSKSQSATKFLDTSQLVGYGAGSKFKKYEVDRIVHAMIFERIIVEKAGDTQSGFTVDYVEQGENAASILNGGKLFHVDFPSAEQKTSGKKKKDSTQKKKRKASTKEEQPAMDVKPEKENAGSNQSIMILDETEDEGSMAPASVGSGSKPRLPKEKAHALAWRIQTFATNWAEEERFCGKTMYYWHIVSGGALKAISNGAPQTLRELENIGVVGEEILKVYGERIVKVVKGFLQQEGIQLDEDPAVAADAPLHSQKRSKTDSSKYF